MMSKDQGRRNQVDLDSLISHGKEFDVFIAAKLSEQKKNDTINLPFKKITLDRLDRLWIWIDYVESEQ